MAWWILQYAIIAIAILASAWVVARKLFPTTTRRLRIALALPLVRESKPGWVRALGRRIAPVPTVGDKACGGCNACEPPRS